MAIHDLKEQIARLPEQPGVYLYYNQKGDTIYVGMPNLAAKISELKKSMDRYGQASHLAVVWQPTKPAPPARSEQA